MKPSQRFPPGNYRFTELSENKCGLYLGRDPTGYKYDVHLSSQKLERDVFRKEAEVEGVKLKLEKIHLYGTHITPYEAKNHDFDEAKLDNGNVVCYIADEGSVIVIEGAGHTSHFAAKDKTWKLIIVSRAHLLVK